MGHVGSKERGREGAEGSGHSLPAGQGAVCSYTGDTHSLTPHTSADLVRVSCHTDTRSDTHSHTIDTRHSVTALGHAACAPTHLSGAPPAMSGPAPLTDRPPSPLTHQPVRHADTVTVFARGGSAGSQAEVRELFDLTGKRKVCTFQDACS